MAAATTSSEKVSPQRPNGRLLEAWGKPGTEPGAFKDVHGFGIDATGTFYASEAAGSRTQKFTPKAGVDKAHLVSPQTPLAPLKK